MTDHTLDIVLAFRAEPYHAPQAVRCLDDDLLPALPRVRASECTPDGWRVLCAVAVGGASAEEFGRVLTMTRQRVSHALYHLCRRGFVAAHARINRLSRRKRERTTYVANVEVDCG